MHRDIFQHQELYQRQALDHARACELQRVLRGVNDGQRRARRQRGPLSWLLRVTGRALIQAGARLANDGYEPTLNLPIAVEKPFSHN
jgi:hypothetical protein